MDGPAEANGEADGPAAPALLLSSARSAANRAVCGLLCNVVDTVSCEGTTRRSDARRDARASCMSEEGPSRATKLARWAQLGRKRADRELKLEDVD